MTKTQELAILDAAITALGPDSYLGPWLASLRGHVERSLRNDFLPMTTEQLHNHEVRVMGEADAQAKDIIAKARAERDAILASAANAADRTRNELRSQLTQALRVIDR